MTGNESLTLLFIFSVISIACTIYGTFSGRRKDITKQAEENAQIKVKLDGIAADQRTMLVKIEKTAEDVTAMREQVLKHGFVLEEHETHINAHERRLADLEKRKDT